MSLAPPRSIVPPIAGVLLAAALFAPTAHAQQADELAERLAGLRAEVEQLSEELASEKAETRNELQALARQKSDLAVELDRETIRVSKLEAALAEERKRVEATSSEGEALAPIFEAAAAGLRGYIRGSLPFRTSDRLAEIDKIEEQRRTGVLTYPRALMRLWTLAEDELRMTRESALLQQTIALDGEDVLADVVRVGMVMLFFETRTGDVGYARRGSDGKIAFVRASGDDEREQIRDLFDSYERQIRVGLFRLPNVLVQELER